MIQDQDPTGMRHLLASLRESGPMPDDLAERIRATLADEQAARTDPDRAGAPDEDSLAEDEGSGFWSTMSEPDGPRRRRSVAPWILGAAAATVVALGVGGLMLSQSGSDEAGSAGDAAPMQTSTQRSATESSAAADGSEAGGEVPAFSITASGTDYTRSSLGSEAATLLEDPTQAPEPKNDKVLGTLTTAAGATDCLTRLGQPQLQAVVIDVATFEGKDGLLLIAQTPPDGEARAWAITSGCEPIWPDSVAVPQ